MCPRGSLTMDNIFKSAQQGRTDSEKGADLKFHIQIPTGWSSPSRVRLCPVLPSPSVLSLEQHFGTAIWHYVPLSCPLSSGLWYSPCLLHTCRLFSSAVVAPLLQSHHGKNECSPSELQISYQLAVLTAAHQQVNPTPDKMSFPSVL